MLEISKWRCSPVSSTARPPKLFENPPQNPSPPGPRQPLPPPLPGDCSSSGGERGGRHGSGVSHLRRRLRGPRPPLPRRLHTPAGPAFASSRSQVLSSPASRHPLIAPPNCTSSPQFNRASVAARFSALQRRVLLLLGLLVLLLRRVGEVVRLRLGAARPPRRPPPCALRRRLPPPRRP